MARRRRGYPLKLDWSDPALDDLRELAGQAPAQARAVFRAAAWLRRVEAVGDIGRAVPGRPGERYWPVAPQGVFFVKDVERWVLTITAVKDARRRRERW